MSSFLDATIIPQKCPRDEGSGPTGRVNGELWIVDGVRKERGRTAEPQNRDWQLFPRCLYPALLFPTSHQSQVTSHSGTSCRCL